MRILIATSHRNLVGGVEKYLEQILPALAGRGHQLALLYEYRFNPRIERIDPLEPDIPNLGVEENSEDAAMHFARRWKPDVVYSQGLESAGLQSALLDEYPTVFYAHNYVGTCVSGEKCHAFPRAQPCDREFGPACLALYHPRRCGGLNPATMWSMYRRTDERRAQLPEYAAILVASAHMRREYERHGVNPDRVHLAPLPNPHPVEADWAEVDGAERTAAGARAAVPSKFIFLGRLTKLKGVAELLRAIPLAEKQLGRPLALTVAGDGPERKRLEDLAAQNRLRVEFAGWMGGVRKKKLIAQADLLIVPSLWPEPFGLVGIEAGAFGLPAVAYDVGGISDWLIAGYSGELAPGQPPTIQGLADAICRALSDPLHYARLCRGAREVAARFTLAVHLSKLESALESALAYDQETPKAGDGFPRVEVASGTEA
jgi:glycosyltransferase involved in cell wall biosynthesis